MILRDAVHGLIAFESEEDAIVERLLACREVQRLRRIRQLGLTSLAFPGAEHTRFSHALGAAHVMQLFLRRVRQIDSELPFWQRISSERARDAIAAALLHDVGHGPLSHTFEEVMPGAVKHEAWTETILLDDGSDVHRALAQDDPGLPARVAALIDGEHELPYLARAVSGTFDVDRCDYLLRDAHGTGVRYGDYDLPWLLRSLCFAEPSEPNRAPGLAIDGLKGLTAIESFLLARQFMFQQVYFHKCSRAAEWMLGAILRRAVALIADGTRLPTRIRVLEAAAASATPSLGEFLELDDQALLFALHTFEQSPDGVLADLCRRLRARALFKTIELGTETEWTDAEEALRRGREIAKDHGLDPESYVGLDTACFAPYDDPDQGSLTVRFPEGRPRAPGDVSFLLGRLRNAQFERTRIVFAPELRGPLRDALRVH